MCLQYTVLPQEVSVVCHSSSEMTANERRSYDLMMLWILKTVPKEVVTDAKMHTPLTFLWFP